MFEALLHYTLANEVREAARKLAEGASDADGAAIREVAEDWFASQTERMRAVLEGALGAAARECFQAFADTFTAAESAGDAAYLRRLVTDLGAQPPLADYPALRRWAMEQWLSEPLASGARLLSEMQTWAEVRARDPNAPALDAWLERGARPPAAPRRPVNSLAAAEARSPAWDDSTPAPSGALEAFAQRRRERRALALEQAQAGMQQMAAERQAFEQEAAARKLAQAQADAEAMKAQAQKLAAVEEEAMKQRENSWGNRIKRIVGGTVSAAVGAFTGGIGAEAGRRAASEIFR